MSAADWCHSSGLELNLRTGEVRRNLVPVPLERQPALALTLLVSNAGRLVTRDELQRRIWGDGTHVDFERGLNYCLRQIRLALGDDARSPRFIETIPRQGYRWIAPVSPTALPARKPRWRARAAIAGLAAGLLVATWTETGARNDTHHRVAVAMVRALHDALF